VIPPNRVTKLAIGMECRPSAMTGKYRTKFLCKKRSARPRCIEWNPERPPRSSSTTRGAGKRGKERMMDKDTFVAFVGVSGFCLAVSAGGWLLASAGIGSAWKVLIVGVLMFLAALWGDR
jgi:hypothetical protein